MRDDQDRCQQPDPLGETGEHYGFTMTDRPDVAVNPDFGALIVTAYNVAPPRPRPDLCWYWSDPSRSRGYWDYC